MLFYEYHYCGVKPASIQLGRNSRVIEPNSHFFLAASKISQLSQVTKVGNVRFVRMVEKDVKKPDRVQPERMELNTNIKRDYEDANKVQRSNFNERRLRSIDERSAYMEAKLKNNQKKAEPTETANKDVGKNDGKKKLVKKAVLVKSNIKRIVQKNNREEVKQEKIVNPETVFDTDIIKNEDSVEEVQEPVEETKEEILVEGNSERDEFGPLKGTKAWDELSHGEKIKIGVARKGKEELKEDEEDNEEKTNEE